MNTYVLTLEADADLQDIYDFGVYKFGETQAIQYLIQLEKTIKKLAENPTIGKERYEFNAPTLSFPYVSHVIFYRITNNGIIIGRILHGSQDYLKLSNLF